MAEVMTETVELTQIFYDEKQRGAIYPFAKPFFNEKLTIFFENSVISKVVKASTADKIGVCSWKLREKLRQRVSPVHNLTYDVIAQPYDVLAFTRQSAHHRMLSNSNVWHPKFWPAFSLLWKKLGHREPLETKQPIYQNHFMARAEIYRGYVHDFLDPAMDLIKNDEELNALCMEDSGYGKIAQGDIKAVQRNLGMNYYPLAPFILERCPSIYFDLKGLKVTYI